jgi:hypothetical protein
MPENLVTSLVEPLKDIIITNKMNDIKITWKEALIFHIWDAHYL